MKTLDEVLKSYELSCGKKDCAQCPYNDECLDHFVCECYERMDDTLHYLKEYRDLQYGYIKAMADLEDNPPLSWTELKQMEGKPVFAEERYRNGDLKSSGWWLIDYWNDDQICLRDQGGNPWNEHRSNYGYGRDWQAYRKERTDG